MTVRRIASFFKGLLLAGTGIVAGCSGLPGLGSSPGGTDPAVIAASIDELKTDTTWSAMTRSGDGVGVELDALGGRGRGAPAAAAAAEHDEGCARRRSGGSGRAKPWRGRGDRRPMEGERRQAAAVYRIRRSVRSSGVAKGAQEMGAP